MQKWEYKVLQGYPSEAQLNDLGNQGWRLIVVVTGGAAKTSEAKENYTGWGAQDVYAYLRRPKN